MNPGGDKMVTTQRDAPPVAPNGPKKKGKPVAVVRFGSASVPVYRLSEKQRTRFAIAYYREGKRMRQVFSSLDATKKEAQLVAQRIQSGMQHMTDLKPHHLPPAN